MVKNVKNYLKEALWEGVLGLQCGESVPEGSRTPNLLIRSQMLYPVKLQGRNNYWNGVQMYKKTVKFQ